VNSSSAKNADKMLIEKCINGDQTSFYVLVEKYHDRCFWTAYKFVHNQEDSQDIVQEAFLKAFKILYKFDTNRSFFTWLYRIVVNASIDFLRKKNQTSSVNIDELQEILADKNADPPSENIELEERSKWVYNILDMMPEPYKTVLVLRELDNKSSKDISDSLNIPHATVRWRLHHARKIFKELWTQYYDKC